MYASPVLPMDLHGQWCSVPLEEKQVYHDVVSPLLPEFLTYSIDFYLPKDELHGKS